MSAISEILRRSRTPWEVVDDLLAGGLLLQTEHEGETFFLRSFEHRPFPESI